MLDYDNVCRHIHKPRFPRQARMEAQEQLVAHYKEAYAGLSDAINAAKRGDEQVGVFPDVRFLNLTFIF